MSKRKKILKEYGIGYIYSLYTPYLSEKGAYGTAIKIGFTEDPETRFKNVSTFIGDFDQEKVYIGKPIFGVKKVHEARAHAKFWKYNLQYHQNPDRVGSHREVYYKNEETIKFFETATFMDIYGLPGTEKEFSSGEVFSKYWFNSSYSSEELKFHVDWLEEIREKDGEQAFKYALMLIEDRFSSTICQVGIEKIKELEYDTSKIWDLLYKRRSKR